MRRRSLSAGMYNPRTPMQKCTSLTRPRAASSLFLVRSRRLLRAYKQHERARDFSRFIHVYQTLNEQATPTTSVCERCGSYGASLIARTWRRGVRPRPRACVRACDSGLRVWMSAGEPERRALHEDAAGKCLREGRMRCAGRRWSCSRSCAHVGKCTATSAQTSSTLSVIWADRITQTPVSL